jgi:hypothetical protein
LKEAGNLKTRLVNIESLLANKFSKEELVSFIENNPNQFNDVYNIATTDSQPQAWRASWLLNQTMVKNDKRLQNKVYSILKLLPKCCEGHQREWLRVLEKLKINENQESVLFDICIKIWQDVFKSPGVRIVAFRFLVKIAKKYPELINEVEPLTQAHFTETLSPGIKNSFLKLKKEIKFDLSPF